MKTFRVRWENTELTSIVEADTIDEAYGMSGEFYFEQGSSGSMPCPVSVEEV